VPHAEEVALLRSRAKSFLARAEDSLAEGDYDIASFLAEQSLQLYLKSILLEELGDFPRTHSISFLIQQIRKIPNRQQLTVLLEKRSDIIRLMEDVYIASRYLPRRYSEEDARLLVNAAKEVLRFGMVL